MGYTPVRCRSSEPSFPFLEMLFSYPLPNSLLRHGSQPECHLPRDLPEINEALLYIISSHPTFCLTALTTICNYISVLTFCLLSDSHRTISSMTALVKYKFVRHRISWTQCLECNSHQSIIVKWIIQWKNNLLPQNMPSTISRFSLQKSQPPTSLCLHCLLTCFWPSNTIFCFPVLQRTCSSWWPGMGVWASSRGHLGSIPQGWTPLGHRQTEQGWGLFINFLKLIN